MVIGVTVMVSSHPNDGGNGEKQENLEKFWKNLEKLTSGNQNHTFKSWKNRIGNFRKILQKVGKIDFGKSKPYF